MIRPEVQELLEEAKEQLMEMYKVADDSVADYVLDIQTAVKFIDYALQSEEPHHALRALQKAHDVLEKEYDETPPDEEYDDLVDRIKAVLTENDNMKRDKVKDMVADTVLEFLNEGVAAEKLMIESRLTDSQKTEITEIVEKTRQHNGFMAFTYGADMDADTAYIGARIDPTNRKDWVRSKEEVLYRVPFRLAESLHSFAKELFKPHE